MNRAGFTMIELIFTIVIIGILSAIAMQKLSATRDDAKMSIETNNLATCISDLGSQYTAKRTINSSESDACAKVIANNCFTDTAEETNGTLTISFGSSTEDWCIQAQTLATNQNLITTHIFGGKRVSY